jgi:hypothetical protein
MQDNYLLDQISTKRYEAIEIHPSDEALKRLTVDQGETLLRHDGLSLVRYRCWSNNCGIEFPATLHQALYGRVRCPGVGCAWWKR